jgi:hypothetical protein
MKKFSKTCLSKINQFILEYDPTLAALLEASSQIKILDDEISTAYCSFREIPKPKLNKLISKLERLLNLLKQLSDSDSTHS